MSKQLPGQQNVVKNHSIPFGTEFPKIASFYWGNSKLSFIRFLTLYTFSILNPDWKMKLYVPQIKDSPFTHTSSEQRRQLQPNDYYHLLSTLSNLEIITVDFPKELGISETLSDIYKSDIIRWKILSEDGGIWADMDIIFHKPMSNMKFKNKTASQYIMCKYPVAHMAYPIGFIISTANCVFYSELYKEALAILSNGTENYQKYGTHIYTAKMNKQKNHSEFFPESVYPVPPAKKLIEQMYDLKNTSFTEHNIGLHWFGGHPLCDNAESTMSPTNVDGFGLISLYVREFERTVGTSLALQLEKS